MPDDGPGSVDDLVGVGVSWGLTSGTFRSCPIRRRHEHIKANGSIESGAAAPTTVCEVLARSVRDHGDRIALRFCRTSECPVADPIANAYNYQRLGAATMAYSQHLAGLGIGRGDKVAMLCENRPEWVVAYFAIHRAGAVLVPIDSSLTADDIGNILKRSGTTLLIASRRHRELASEAVGPAGVAMAVLDDDVAGLAVEESIHADDLLCPGVTADDPAVLSFTSGTTGVSKGIVLTHRNVVSNATISVDVLEFTPDNRMLSILPLNHMFEQTVGMLMPMAAGASIYYPGSQSPRVLFEALADARPTLTLMVPALARRIQARIEGRMADLPAVKRFVAKSMLRLSRCTRRCGVNIGKRLFGRIHETFGGHMRFIIAGGAALEDSVAEFFLDIGLPMLQGYGLTETSPVISTNIVGRHRVGSVGVPIPQTEVRVEPVDGAADQDSGELLVRGPGVMAGYYEDPEATAAVMQDGWLRTGDLGRVDGQGFVYIDGRAKDVIVNKNGKNIFPAEIEAAVLTSGLIKEACALGVRQDVAAVLRKLTFELFVPAHHRVGVDLLPDGAADSQRLRLDRG